MYLSRLEQCVRRSGGIIIYGYIPSLVGDFVVFFFWFTHYASGEFSASFQVRPGHCQHFTGASFLRPPAARTQGPATQLVPPGWASSSLTLLVCGFCRVLGAARLFLRLCFLVRACVALLALRPCAPWVLYFAGFQVLWVFVRGLPSSEVTSHKSSALSSHQMS